MPQLPLLALTAQTGDVVEATDSSVTIVTDTDDEFRISLDPWRFTRVDVRTIRQLNLQELGGVDPEGFSWAKCPFAKDYLFRVLRVAQTKILHADQQVRYTDFVFYVCAQRLKKTI